ncbi:MAG: hypothetical protein WC385_00810 [Candidatus Paceibacterota bacterium]|jgi:hypothetical protein
MNNLEQEIAELQKMITAKRDELEKQGGIVEEKELVRQSVKEMFLDKTVPATSTPATTQADAGQTQTVPSTGATQTVPPNGSYLDYLDPQTADTINKLIGEIQTKGIAPVIDEAAGQEPFVIDAFHDALVDKLYDELKERGLVNPV